VNSPEAGLDPSAVLANRIELLERAADDLAHEIKNPLHSMVINLEVLRRRLNRLEGASDADVFRYVEVLGDEVERLSHRVDILLRLLRTGREHEPVSLNDVVHELWELVRLRAGRRNIRVEFAPDEVAGARYVPREPTRQIILNLVLEALDSLEPGQALHVRSEQGHGVLRLELGGGCREPVGDAAGTREGARPRLAVAEMLSREIGGSVGVDRIDGQTNFSLSFAAPR
jgi:signal transduction histidine kinase